MQFIPGTWRVVGVDANGDGRKDPQNLADAATATAVYLCSGPGDLSTDSGARSAVLRYNHSDAYADQVLAIAAGYRGGYTVVPGSDLTDVPAHRLPLPALGRPADRWPPTTRVKADAAAPSRAAGKPAQGPGRPKPGSPAGPPAAARCGSTPDPSTTAGTDPADRTSSPA